jgi:hypothetical protein
MYPFIRQKTITKALLVHPFMILRTNHYNVGILNNKTNYFKTHHQSFFNWSNNNEDNVSTLSPSLIPSPLIINQATSISNKLKHVQTINDAKIYCQNVIDFIETQTSDEEQFLASVALADTNGYNEQFINFAIAPLFAHHDIELAKLWFDVIDVSQIDMIHLHKIESGNESYYNTMLIGYPKIFTAIIQLMRTHKHNPELVTVACNVCNMWCESHRREEFVQSGAAEALLEIITIHSNNYKVLTEACQAIGSLCCNDDSPYLENQIRVRRLGGCEILVKLAKLHKNWEREYKQESEEYKLMSAVWNTITCFTYRNFFNITKFMQLGLELGEIVSEFDDPNRPDRDLLLYFQTLYPVPDWIDCQQHPLVLKMQAAVQNKLISSSEICELCKRIPISASGLRDNISPLNDPKIGRACWKYYNELAEFWIQRNDAAVAICWLHGLLRLDGYTKYWHYPKDDSWINEDPLYKHSLNKEYKTYVREICQDYMTEICEEKLYETNVSKLLGKMLMIYSNNPDVIVECCQTIVILGRDAVRWEIHVLGWELAEAGVCEVIFDCLDKNKNAPSVCVQLCKSISFICFHRDNQIRFGCLGLCTVLVQLLAQHLTNTEVVNQICDTIQSMCRENVHNNIHTFIEVGVCDVLKQVLEYHEFNKEISKLPQTLYKEVFGEKRKNIE